MFQYIKPFNFILAVDSYKNDHGAQLAELPTNPTDGYSSIVPRKLPDYATDIVAMGQTLVAFFLTTIRIEQWMIEEAEKEITQHGADFDRDRWQVIVDEYDGWLPLAMYGVEEGRVIQPQTPIVAFKPTDKRYAWLAAYFETWEQEIIWKMSTVATSSRACRKTWIKYIEMTGSDMGVLNTRHHNFGDRAADSPEEAPVMASMAHGALFDGSDCVRANGYIKVLYNTDKAYLSSIEATEHSVMTAHSNTAEKDDFPAAEMLVKRLIKAVDRANRGIGIPFVSGVIDTFNSRRFVQEYTGKRLKEEIIATGGVLIHRPDSGNPEEEPGLVGNDLEATFGCSEPNEKGYKDLHPSVGVIQGDGINVTTLDGVLKGWTDQGYTVNAFATGSGEGITHFGGRGDCSFSMKATALKTEEDGWTRLLKDPITDSSKKSLSGLVRNRELPNGELETFDCLDYDNPEEKLAEEGPGWRLWAINGQRKWTQTFDDVQERARAL